jgi:intein-encoded DNA endonuclease-like protein
MQQHTTIFELVNRQLRGQLKEKLELWREEGLSFESMSRRLEFENQIVVTSATVRRWCQNFGIGTNKARAS